MAMGGRVAEQLVFGVVSTGANNDLVVSTERARKMVREWGMSDRVGPMAWGSQGQVFLGEDLMHNARDYSDETARVIDEEVEKILRYCEDRCRATLTENRNGLNLVARSLLEHETINGAEVHRLVKMGRTGLTAPDARVRIFVRSSSGARYSLGFADPGLTQLLLPALPPPPPSRLRRPCGLRIVTRRECLHGFRTSCCVGSPRKLARTVPVGVGQHEAGHGLDAVALVQGSVGHRVELLHGHVRRGQGLGRLPRPRARQARRRGEHGDEPRQLRTGEVLAVELRGDRPAGLGGRVGPGAGPDHPGRQHGDRAEAHRQHQRRHGSIVPGRGPARSAGGARRREVQLAVACGDAHGGRGAGPAGLEQHTLGRQGPVTEDLNGHPLGGDELVQADLAVLPRAQGERGLGTEGPDLAVDDRAELHLDR